MFCFRRALSLVLLGSLIFGDAVALVHTGVYHRDSCCDAHQACGTGPTAVSDPHASCQEQHRSCAHASVDETAAAEEPCGDPSTVPHDHDSCVICRWLAHPQAPEVPDGSTIEIERVGLLGSAIYSVPSTEHPLLPGAPHRGPPPAFC